MTQINVIPLDSPEAHLIADHLENGSSYQTTCTMINVKKDNQPLLTLSSVYGCVLRLNPLVTSAKKLKQGSINPQDPWCIARKVWVSQLLVRIIVLEINEENIPSYFDISKMASLDLTRIGFCDEVHKKLHI